MCDAVGGNNNSGLAYHPESNRIWILDVDELHSFNPDGDCEKTLRAVDVAQVARSLAYVPEPAPPFVINSGPNHAWLNPATRGQGFFVRGFPDIGMIFLAWITYETDQPPEDLQVMPGEHGHRWITAFGPYAGNEAVLEIEITSRGIFDSGFPESMQSRGGTNVLDFSDCEAATVAYDIPSIDRRRVTPIRRISPDNVARSESLTGQR